MDKKPTQYQQIQKRFIYFNLPNKQIMHLISLSPYYILNQDTSITNLYSFFHKFSLKTSFPDSIKYSMKSEEQVTDEVLTIVYHLTQATQQWEQLDTGLLKFHEDLDEEGVLIGHSVIVTKIPIPGDFDEDPQTQRTIFKSSLQPEKMYAREQGTIIYWNEIQLNEQIAVTFSDKKTCDKLWKRICSFIGKNPFQVGILPPPDSVDAPRQDNLAKLLTSVVQKQEAISYYIINKTGFLQDLLLVCVKILEEHKQELIFIMYKILRGIIEYNDTRIIQILFSSQAFAVILQIYNKCLNPNKNFIEDLAQRFNLINIIQFDQQIIEKIKVSHHITFFKDVVLASMAEIPLQAALELSIKQCNLDILNYVTSGDVIPQLKDKIISGHLSPASDFLFQLLIFSKQFSDDIKNKLIEKYYSQGIVSALSQILNNRQYFIEVDHLTQLRIFEILVKLSHLNQKLFLQFIKGALNVLQSLTYYFHNCRSDLMDSISEIFRNLLTNNLDKKIPLDLMTNYFFKIEATNIKEDYLRHINCVKQAEKMVGLIIVSVEVNEGLKVSKVLDLLSKFNIFQLLNKVPLSKIQKLQRLKLVNIIISYNSQEMLQIQQALVTSKFLRSCILWLKQSNSKNNLIQSSILNILQKINSSQKFIFMEEIQSIQHQLPQNKLILEIVNKLEQLRQQANVQLQRHHQILSNELEERYLSQQNQFNAQRKLSISEPRSQVQESLKLLTQQLGKKQSFQQDLVRVPLYKKSAQFSFEFNNINQA